MNVQMPPDTPPHPTTGVPLLATPDITPAQIGALITMIAGQAVAWGYMSDANAQHWVAIATIVLPAILAVADAVIRHGRAVGSANRTG